MCIVSSNNSLRLLNDLLAFRKNKLDVARVRHVRVDTTMCTVGSSALLWSLIDLDVLDNQIARVKALGIRICFSVLQETEEELG